MDGKLEKLHQQMIDRDDVKTAIIYSLRNWLAYRFMPAGDAVHMQRAYHGAMTAFRRNEPHVRLLTLAIFMATEGGHFDTAGAMLDSALSYRGFLKSDEPFYYGAMCFLRAYLAIKQQKNRAAKKYRKTFLAYVKAARYSAHYDVMMGQIYIAGQEFPQAYECLTRAYANGCRSVYIYESLFCCYQDGSVEPGGELLDVLAYAAARGGDISRAIAANENAIFNAILKNPEKGEGLYRLSEQSSLLKAICTNRINKGDCSLEANILYSAAVENHLRINRLELYLIKSAHQNRVEDVATYALGQFLLSNESEPDLVIYAYHLLLSNPAHSRLLQGREDVIMSAAARALKSGVRSREANSLYQFYWERNRDSTKDMAKKAQAILQAGLTQFELTPSPQARYIYISHPEKRGMNEYELPGEESSLVIDAADNFSYICMGAGKRQIINGLVGIRRILPLAGPELYRYFFNKGDLRFYVVAYLASYYLDTGADIGAAPIYEAMLEHKSIPISYKNRLLTALGHLYQQRGDYSKAMACYADADIYLLEEADVQKILEAYLQNNEYELAATLITKHYESIPVSAVYEGLCRLINKSYNPPDIAGLGQAAYSLLISGYNDDALLSFALEYHNASLSELIALSSALTRWGGASPTAAIDNDANLLLDTKILAAGLWMRQYDPQIQRAFRKLYAGKKAPKEIAEFVEMLIFAVLTQNLLPEYETINVLEKIYLDYGDMYLLLALCHIYLQHKIATIHTNKLMSQGIAAQEDAGILLPVFKENKPFPYPYLEKYQPFIYQSPPGKDIRLYFRYSSEGDFKSAPMEYLGYGLYVAKLPLFYNETVTYYYSEEMGTGSITTPEASHKNTNPYLHENNSDSYFAINNAIIYEQMFRHEMVEGIVEGLVGEAAELRGQPL